MEQHERDATQRAEVVRPALVMNRAGVVSHLRIEPPVQLVLDPPVRATAEIYCTLGGRLER